MGLSALETVGLSALKNWISESRCGGSGAIRTLLLPIAVPMPLPMPTAMLMTDAECDADADDSGHRISAVAARKDSS